MTSAKTAHEQIKWRRKKPRKPPNWPPPWEAQTLKCRNLLYKKTLANQPAKGEDELRWPSTNPLRPLKEAGC